MNGLRWRQSNFAESRPAGELKTVSNDAPDKKDAFFEAKKIAAYCPGDSESALLKSGGDYGIFIYQLTINLCPLKSKPMGAGARNDQQAKTAKSMCLMPMFCHTV